MERIAQRLKSIPSSGTMSVADRVRELRRQGVDNISFVNRPPVPPPVIEAARFFLDEAHVMTVPGSSFGPNGEGHVRLLFACTEDEARQAATRIRDAVSRL